MPRPLRVVLVGIVGLERQRVHDAAAVWGSMREQELGIHEATEVDLRLRVPDAEAVSNLTAAEPDRRWFVTISEVGLDHLVDVQEQPGSLGWKVIDARTAGLAEQAFGDLDVAALDLDELLAGVQKRGILGVRSGVSLTRWSTSCGRVSASASSASTAWSPSPTPGPSDPSTGS